MWPAVDVLCSASLIGLLLAGDTVSQMSPSLKMWLQSVEFRSEVHSDLSSGDLEHQPVNREILWHHRQSSVNHTLSPLTFRHF